MSKTFYFFILFLSLFTAEKMLTQTSAADSLESVLNLYKSNDTVKINLLIETGIAVYDIDSKKTLNYANQAFELSEKLNYLKGKSESLWLIGRYYVKSDKSLALDYFKKAIEIAQLIGYKTGIAKYLNACGVIYKIQGNNTLCIECYQKAIKISEEVHDKLGTAKYLQNLSIAYSGLGEYDKAIDGYKKALKILEDLDEKYVRSRCLNNLGYIYEFRGYYPLALEYYQKSLKISEEQDDRAGIMNCYISLGNLNSSQKDYKKALEQIQNALKIAEELNDKIKISLCFEKIGNIYQQTNNPQALKYFQNSFKIAEELDDKAQKLIVLDKIGDFFLSQHDNQNAFKNYQNALQIALEMDRKRVICDLWSKIGKIYFTQKNYNSALNYTLKSLTVANDLKLLNNQKDINGQLADIYAATGDFENAFLHHKMYKELNDQIFNEKNIKKMAELEFTFKNEREKQAIELEQQRKDVLNAAKKRQQTILLMSLIIAFVLMSIIAIFLYRSYRFKNNTNILLTLQKHEIEELNAEYLSLNEELKQSNEQLYYAKSQVEKSEEKLNLLIKNSNDIFVLVNEKGEQFFISEAAKNLTGYSVQELLGAVKDVIYPEDIEIVQKHWERVLTDKNKADCIQYRHKHKEKGYVWFEAVAQNFLDEPAINAIVANIRDISERKKTEEALRASEATKNRLFKQERNRIFDELVSNQKTLAATTLKLIQKSERDANTIKQLADIEEHTNQEGKKIINKIISDHKHASFDSNWNEFELLFEKVHYFFYEKLNAKFPDLTANERKLCAFLKLNMSSKEIAQITFQSEDALKKARLRLRQKLGIDRETNLITFLQNI